MWNKVLPLTEYGYDVALGRLTKLCHQQDRRGEQALRRIVKEGVLTEAGAITAGHDDGLGDDFGVLLGPGFVGQPALLLVQIGVFIDQVQEVEAVALGGIAQIYNGNPIAVAVPGDASIVAKNIALGISILE